MNIDEILVLTPFSKVLTELERDPVSRETDKWNDEYKGTHEILKKKNKFKGQGASKETVVVAKEVITLQKKIVRTEVAFLFGEPVSIVFNDGADDAYQAVVDVWNENKLDYFNRKIARRIFIETKVAELWYVVKKEGEDSKIRVQILSKENGDSIFAHYDDNGDLDAITRRFQTVIAGKKIDCVDIFTADKTIHATKPIAVWVIVEEPNIFKKIPVIYYEIDTPVWNDVQTLIDRLENMVSKFADTNDYFGSPILKLKGEVEGMASKEEIGKVIQFKGEVDKDGNTVYEGDAEYLTWEQGPDAIKLEYEILKDLIFSMVSCPDLSFNNVKGITAISGVAIRLMFSDAIFKAKDNEELFGEMLTRRLNLIKAIIGTTTNIALAKKLLELDIEIQFNSVLPEDIKELIESLSVARGGEPIMSHDSAVRQNPLVNDPDADIKLLEEEQGSSALTELGAAGESFNVEGETNETV